MIFATKTDFPLNLDFSLFYKIDEFARLTFLIQHMRFHLFTSKQIHANSSQFVPRDTSSIKIRYGFQKRYFFIKRLFSMRMN